jgi:polyisoprenoid-binding protein YceI
MRKLSTILLPLFLAGATLAADYAVDPKYDSTLVQFESDGKLEFIAGKTNDLAGSFVFDPAQPRRGATGMMQVDLRTLKTGIGLRDEHMRDNHLETDKFPFAWFELTEVTGLPEAFDGEQGYEVEGKGFFYLHGIKRLIDVDLILTVEDDTEASALKVSAKFSLFLDDFEVERPKALFLKLAERIDLEVIFLASTNNSMPDITLPNWPEKQ